LHQQDGKAGSVETDAVPGVSADYGILRIFPISLAKYMKYSGGCHCEGVRFEVETSAELELERCNCSICTKSGYLHLIVPRKNFSLIRGGDLLETYRFNTQVAQHFFCKNCGIKPFYIPRTNPDGIDVNANCLDEFPHAAIVKNFDGQNWEDNAHKLAHKSRAD